MSIKRHTIIYLIEEQGLSEMSNDEFDMKLIITSLMAINNMIVKNQSVQSLPQDALCNRIRTFFYVIQYPHTVGSVMASVQIKCSKCQ